MDRSLEPRGRIALSAYVRLEGLTKRLGGRDVVRSIDLDIGKGELVSLLGASGCGKTTTLNLVAGFLRPDAGRILVDGAEIQATPAHRRNMGMVFQSYALFPHLTVEQNVAFGLALRKLDRETMRERIASALARVRLTGYEKRYPRELSGGQQQRVALARALVIEPSVLLLDEPFSNLDAKLRDRLRDELSEIQRSIGITTIFVTHDQDEALAISDRVAVMNDGRIEQIGSPNDVYHTPKTPFVAEFVGDVNAIAGRVAGYDDDRMLVETGGVKLAGRAAERPPIGADVMLYIRPEAIRFEHSSAALAGTIERVTFLGARCRYAVACAHGTVVAEAATSGDQRLATGSHVAVGWDPNEATVIVRA